MKAPKNKREVNQVERTMTHESGENRSSACEMMKKRSRTLEQVTDRASNISQLWSG